MWERFSYYGMRSLLILYLVNYLLADPVRAAQIMGYPALEGYLTSVFGPMNVQQMGSQIYGLYTGFVYLTPLFGGILADQWLGQYRTVYLGGALMATGHFLMASERLFFLALLFLIVGNGCFKPNISTQVGNLYKPDDHRRDGAYVIFYMGVNLGAFFSPLICGTLGQKVGWHWGFGAAGVGMLLGLVLYYFGSGMVPHDTLKVKKEKKAESKALTSKEWMAVGTLVLLCALNIMFWAVYEQQGNTLQLWADTQTDWNFFGWEMPSSWFQAFNPFFIFVLSPGLIALWNRQSKKGKEPSSVVKMGIGCVLCGAAYIVMIAAAQALRGGEKGSVMWLVACTLLFTIGELYLSPVGLSLVTKVSPKKIVSMMMGVWFLSSFFGNYMTGYLGTFYSVMDKEAYFAMLCAMGVGTGVIFFLLRKPMSRAFGSGRV